MKYAQIILALVALGITTQAEAFLDQRFVDEYNAALGITTAQAEEQPLTTTFKEGRCLVEYHGGTYLDGPCSIELRSDGMFAVLRPSGEAVASVNSPASIVETE